MIIIILHEIIEHITFLAGEGGNTLNKPSGSAASSSSSCLVLEILREDINGKKRFLSGIARMRGGV